MNSQVVCSACRAVFAAGATFCPNCRLPLTAQALPLVRRPRPIGLWIVGGFVALLLFSIAIQSLEDARAEWASQALVTDIQSGRLNTAQAFEARCGVPQWTRETKEGPELHYRTKDADLYVTLAAAGPRFESEQVDLSTPKPSTYRIALDAPDATRQLGCR